MKFNEYISKKNLQTESEEVRPINEFSGDEATEVDFGLFSVGGGGEIDAAAAAVGAAALIAMKGIYNYGVYKWLQSKLPNYIEQYKITQAKSSSEVWDAVWERDKINPLKEKKRMLLGTGGEREDSDVEDAAPERGAKQQIKDKFRAILAKKGIPQEKKEELRNQRDQALANVDKQIQALSDEIEKLEEESKIAYAQQEEEFRKLDEKFEEQQDKFISVGDSLFASAWKKRWDVEFKNAKGQADIEVLEKSLQLAREAKNKRELEAIQGMLQRSKESQAEAKAALDEVMDETAQADLQKASYEELGIVAFEDARKAYEDQGGTLETIYNKWQALGKTYQSTTTGKDSGGRDKKASLEKKIETAEAKIEKGENAAEKARADKEYDKAVKIEKAVEKIKDDLKGYKEEIANLPESFSDDEFFRLSLHINEASVMLDQLLEQGNKNKVKGTWSIVRKTISKVINDAPQEKREELATEAVKDAKTASNFKADIIKKQNVMVGLIEKRKKDNAEAKESGYDEDVKPMPEGSEDFAKLPRIKGNEFEEKLKPFEDFIETLSKSFNADTNVEGEKPKEPEEAGDKDIEDLEVGDEEKDPEIIKQAKALARAEANLKKFVNEFEPDEDEEDDQKTIEKVRELRSEIKKHRKKGETEDAEKKQQEIDDLIRNNASTNLSSKFDKLQDAVKKEREKLTELKNKKSEGAKKAPSDQNTPTEKTESQETKIAPKYMKFEEYLAMKNRK